MNAPVLTLPEMAAILARVPALLFNTTDCTTDRVEAEERREPTEAELSEYRPAGHSHGIAF